jgi:hypothetical protein
MKILSLLKDPGRHTARDRQRDAILPVFDN